MALPDAAGRRGAESRPGSSDRRGRVGTIALRGWLIAVIGALALGAAPAAGDEPQVPPSRGFVNDFAGVIDAGTARALDALIQELTTRTGAEIAVITVESTQPLSAFDYAMKVAETWKPGARGKDNGVVFLTAVRDRDLFILTGYGIEGALPDGKVGEIRDRMILPRFRQRDYAGGIRAGTEALAATIAAEYGVTLSGVPPLPRRSAPPVGGIVPLIVGMLILIILWRTGLWPLLFLPRHRGHWGGGFGGGGFGGFGGGFGGGGGSSGGGFGGFGGGGFGGGGAGGRW